MLAHRQHVVVLLRGQVTHLADNNVGAFGKALQRFAQRRQHNVGGVTQALVDTIENIPQHRLAFLRQFRQQFAQTALGIGFEGFIALADAGN